MRNRQWLRLLNVCFAGVLFAILGLLSGCAMTGGISHSKRFSASDIANWRSKAFVGQTQYSLTESDGAPVLKADSQQTASALYQGVDIDLEKTPYLNWRWKVDATLGELDEQQKSGDDHPARLFVILHGRLFTLAPKALSYVWASNTPAGGHWPNAYHPEVITLALQSGEQHTGQWVSEKRNLKADLQQYFGEDIRYISGLAIMTDTDDSKSAAVAYYGDIYFSAQ